MGQIRPRIRVHEGQQDFDDLPSGDGILILSPDQVILSATLQAERLLRRRLEHGQSLPLTELFPETYLPQAEVAFRETLESGVMRALLLTQVRLEPDQTRFLKYSISPLYGQNQEIVGAVLAFHDDTLTKSWSAWSNFGLGVTPDAVFDNFDRGLFVVNQRRIITAFNRAAQEITGFTPEEVLGRYCWEVLQADRCKTRCALNATLEDGVPRKDLDVRIRSKSGRWLNLLISTSPIRNKREAIVGGVETFQSLGLALPRREARPPIPGEVKIIGRSPPMVKLLDMLPDVANSEATVVIEGESGTGKDLFAQAIHQKSPRAQGPFVAFSCSALVETLIESELFGHVKGAFTGAISHKVGRFELAKGGTLFLDEIGELKLELQAKLLRVLESKVFERVGGTQPIPLEARIIAATSRNLVEEVRQGRFRMDLFYRLRTVPFYLPALRDRQEDIPLLVNHFLTSLNRKYHKNVRGVDPKVLSILQQYAWPGNIRELERVLEYAFVFVKGAVITKDLLPELESPRPRTPAPPAKLNQQRWDSERLAIEKALRKARGNREAAARVLGISRSSLWRKMKAYDLL
ncbi:MAG: sigma 54-interacting transcriptional regulator [Thermodesulfobacteriota bacterium]